MSEPKARPVVRLDAVHPPGVQVYQVGAGCGVEEGPGHIVKSIQLCALEDGGGATILFRDGTSRLIPEHSICAADFAADDEA